MTYDDHGTLRDVDGNPMAYRVLHPTLPSVPLNEASIWPEHLLMVNAFRNGRVVQVPPTGDQRSSAESFAERIEASTTRRLGLVACPGTHDGPNCRECGAAR